VDLPWRLDLLGGLRATQGNRVIERFRSQKTGVLLAYLAYHCDRTHPREALLELLWPECEPHSGRQRLSTALSWLRDQLERPLVESSELRVESPADADPSKLSTLNSQLSTLNSQL
jgi:DNA-binding SARP family transcriptional activator